MSDGCELCRPDMVLIENDLAFVRYDNNSLSKGHVLADPAPARGGFLRHDG